MIAKSSESDSEQGDGESFEDEQDIPHRWPQGNVLCPWQKERLIENAV